MKDNVRLSSECLQLELDGRGICEKTGEGGESIEDDFSNISTIHDMLIYVCV